MESSSVYRTYGQIYKTEKMKIQRSPLGSSMRKGLQSPSESQLKGRKESPSFTSSLFKPRSCHHSPKLSTVSRPSKLHLSRGNALELLLHEDLKKAKDLGRRSEVTAIGRIFDAVMDRSAEFRSVLKLLQQRYEALIEAAATETETAQFALEQHQEEKRKLMKRIEVLMYENSQLRGGKGHTGKNTFESTERLTAIGKVHHSYHHSLPDPKIPIPRLNLNLLAQSPVKRDPIYIEDM